jgi:hypothetical protein
MYQTNLELSYLNDLAIRVRSIVIKTSLHNVHIGRKAPELLELVLGNQVTSAKDVLHLIRDKHALKLFLWHKT